MTEVRHPRPRLQLQIPSVRPHYAQIPESRPAQRGEPGECERRLALRIEEPREPGALLPRLREQLLDAHRLPRLVGERPPRHSLLVPQAERAQKPQRPCFLDGPQRPPP